MMEPTARYDAPCGRVEESRLREPVTVAIINFNGRHHLRECIEAVRQADGPIAEVIMVDDCSTDGSAELVEAEFPWVKVIRHAHNQGAAAARNTGIEMAKNSLIALLDNDTVVTPGWLLPLVEAIKSDHVVGLCTSRVLIHEMSDIIDRQGDDAHFTGNPTKRHDHVPAAECPLTEPEEVGSASGISFLIDRSRIGGQARFDKDFFVLHEDLDFCLLIRSMGYKCFAVPSSVVYHKYMNGGNAGTTHESSTYPLRRAFLTFRNRWFIVIKYYDIRTLILLAPALLFFEIVCLTFALRRGVFSSYVRAWRSILNGRASLMAKRRTIQSMKVVNDKLLLSGHALTLGLGAVQGTLERIAARFVSGLLSGYWIAVRPFLRNSSVSNRGGDPIKIKPTANLATPHH